MVCLGCVVLCCDVMRSCSCLYCFVVWRVSVALRFSLLFILIVCLLLCVLLVLVFILCVYVLFLVCHVLYGVCVCDVLGLHCC